jgi:hypothetical protein
MDISHTHNDSIDLRTGKSLTKTQEKTLHGQ